VIRSRSAPSAGQILSSGIIRENVISAEVKAAAAAGVTAVAAKDAQVNVMGGRVDA
jgi:hypothetical protein